MTTIDHAGHTAIPLEPIRFERRSFERRPADGTVVAAVTDLLGQTRLARVQLLDRSAGGVGLASSVELEQGARIEIHAPDRPEPTLFGTIVRCEPFGHGYRIGVRAGSRAQAA